MALAIRGNLLSKAEQGMDAVIEQSIACNSGLLNVTMEKTIALQQQYRREEQALEGRISDLQLRLAEETSAADSQLVLFQAQLQPLETTHRTLKETAERNKILESLYQLEGFLRVFGRWSLANPYPANLTFVCCEDLPPKAGRDPKVPFDRMRELLAQKESFSDFFSLIDELLAQFIELDRRVVEYAHDFQTQNIKFGWTCGYYNEVGNKAYSLLLALKDSLIAPVEPSPLPILEPISRQLTVPSIGREVTIVRRGQTGDLLDRAMVTFERMSQQHESLMGALVIRTNQLQRGLVATRERQRTQQLTFHARIQALEAENGMLEEMNARRGLFNILSEIESVLKTIPPAFPRVVAVFDVIWYFPANQDPNPGGAFALACKSLAAKDPHIDSSPIIQNFRSGYQTFKSEWNRYKAYFNSGVLARHNSVRRYNGDPEWRDPAAYFKKVDETITQVDMLLATLVS